jgi:pyroglutamyl-peptidase
MHEPTKPSSDEAHSTIIATTKSTWLSTAELHNHCCRFIVTGFGPFCNVPYNPTSVLIHRLRNEKGLSATECTTNLSATAAAAAATTDRYTTTNSSSSSAAPIIEETHILETSAEFVRAWFDDLHERLMSSISSNTVGATTNSNTNSEKEDTETTTITFSEEMNASNSAATDAVACTTTVLLHLGVDYNSSQFKLEQCAYNDATFRVPDERGYQPHCECIILDGNIENKCSEVDASSSAHRYPSWGKCLRTTLDLQSLRDELQQCTNEHVTISTDPGRFVCNYTYYLSLDRCHSMNSERNSISDDNNQREMGEGGWANNETLAYHALFLHVPPFEAISEDIQLNFIHQVMKHIGGRIREKSTSNG